MVAGRALWQTHIMKTLDCLIAGFSPACLTAKNRIAIPYPENVFPLSDLSLQMKPLGGRTDHMYSISKLVRRTSLVCALLLAVTTVRAVDPPPDGGYPNENTAEGEDALLNLAAGVNNTAVGFHALFGDTMGDNNTAVGWIALRQNSEGLANTAIGASAMRNNTTGDANAAFGAFALLTNSTGFRNTTVGVESLKRSNGSDNIAVGYEAGMNIGTGSNTICIGHPGLASDTNTIRIGTDGIQTATFIAGIREVPVVGVGVVITADGQLGVRSSSARFKEAIKPMNKASEAILSLQPVSFRYKKDFDPDRTPQFGLVAEEVAKVDPDLVARDAQGKPYTVRYEEVNAMLLNEFIKEHKHVQEQASEISQLKSALKEQGAQLEALESRLDAKGL